MALQELELLKKRFEEQQEVYRACAEQARSLWWPSRLLVQAWLVEILLMMSQLERRLAQMSAGTPPLPIIDAAWRRFWDILTALAPAAAPEPKKADHPAERANVRAVGWRLQIVFVFLVLQIVFALFLLGVSVRVFNQFDPQTTLTREQWEERLPARAEVRRVRSVMEQALEQTRKAPAPAAPVAPPPPGGPAAGAGPDVILLRGEVEALVASLAELRLATRDLRLANLWLENVLNDLDKDPPDLANAVKVLTELEQALENPANQRPPDPIRLIVLGSLLGMITITIHLNWKFRNRWDTLGFLPWYVTKLVAAPVLSLAAAALLFQVSFTGDLSAATDLRALGLRGASPLLIFAIAIITGMFSNKVFEWLRGLAGARAAVAPPRPSTPAKTPEPEDKVPPEE